MLSETEALSKEIELSPPGYYKKYKGNGIGVENDIYLHINNMDIIESKISNALASRCYIEVISLRLQLMDYWLRIFYTNKADNLTKRKKEFGALLDQCKDLGLNIDLFNSVNAFNKNRIKAIHGFVIGAINYDILESIAQESENTLILLILFVIDNCGEVITKLDGYNKVGDVIYKVPELKRYYQNIMLRHNITS